MPGLLASPSASNGTPPSPLTSLPHEVLVQICLLLPAPTLAILSGVSRSLRDVAVDDQLWNALGRAEFGVEWRNLKEAWPFGTARGFFVGVLRRWGWTLGYWQANYPFFSGQLLHVRVDTHTARIIAERITAAPSTEEPPSVPFGPMHGVTMDSLTLNLTRRRVFDIKFEKADVCYRRLRGMSYREAARTSTGFRAHMEGLVDGVGMERSNSTEVLSEASVAASSAAAPPDCSSAYDQEGISSYVLCCGAKVGQAVVRDHLGTLTEAVDTYADYHSTIDHFPVFNPSPITGLWPYPESSRALRNDGALITMFDSNEPPLAFNRHQPANTVQHEEHGEDEEYELGHASPVMRGRRPRRKAKPPKPSLLALHCKSTCHQYGVRTVTLRAPEGELRFRAAKFHTVWSKIKCSGLQHQPTPPTPTSLCPAFTPTSHPSPPPPPSSSHPTLSFLSSLYSTRPGPSPRMKIQPREGIWAGTYGTHGVEFLLLRYEWGEMTMFNAAAAMAEGEAGADYVPHDNHAYDEGDTTSTRATTAKPHIPTVDMVFYKVTGDVNVPRGEISFRAHLGDGSGSEFVSAPPETVFTTAINASNVSPGNASAAGGAAGGGGGAYKPYAMLSDPSFSDELRGARAYDGDGTVAMSGYRSPTRIRNEVIVISPTQIAVLWHDLRKASRFVLVE